jgi:hypothetical protein
MKSRCKELILIDLVVIQDVKSIKSKLFYETIKSKLMMVAEKSALYSAESSSLGDYPDKQRVYWKTSKSIIVYENENQLREFIETAKTDKKYSKKVYFGTVNKDLAKSIKIETGMDVEGYNVTISADEIRKIFKDHGNEKTESLRGQRAIAEDDIVNIPLIIQNPDKIMLSNELYKGKPVIVFVKTINGRTTIVSYMSSRQHDLRVQTMYSGKKKPTPDTAANVQAPALTSKTSNGTESASIS